MGKTAGAKCPISVGQSLTAGATAAVFTTGLELFTGAFSSAGIRNIAADEAGYVSLEGKGIAAGEADTYSNYALDATKNAKSNNVVLGKYMQDNVSYVDVATKNKATYFQLDNWNEVSNLVGDKNMWNINKEFLNQQWIAGKEFYFSHNPWEVTGYLQQEALHLIDLGAKDFVKIGDMWKLIK